MTQTKKNATSGTAADEGQDQPDAPSVGDTVLYHYIQNPHTHRVTKGKVMKVHRRKGEATLLDLKVQIHGAGAVQSRASVPHGGSGRPNTWSEIPAPADAAGKDAETPPAG